jgi:hypothetical protein
MKGIGMKNLLHDEYEEKANKHGQYFRQALTAEKTAKAVAAVILAATLGVATAEEGADYCPWEPDVVWALPVDWTLSAGWALMWLASFFLAMRGAVALVRDVQRYGGELPVAPPPLVVAGFAAPMQIKICRTKGTKFHTMSCGEVSADRGRVVGVFTPCAKCIGVLGVANDTKGLM